MKFFKYFNLFLLLIFLFFIFYYQINKFLFKSQGIINKKIEDKKIFIYNLEGKNYKLLIADKPLDWERGLMFVKKPVDFDGMIFIFPDKQIRTFWNKNTFVDLDIYWLVDDEIIGKDFLPSIDKTKEIYSLVSSGPVNKVIEIIK